MSNNAIASMLLSSTDPARLRSWYATAFQPDDDAKEGEYRVLRFGGFWLMIDTRDDVGETNPEPGRMIINFDVEDARATVDRLNSLETRWLAELEDREGSLFATAIDPDGNYVQLIQPSEEMKAQMGS